MCVNTTLQKMNPEVKVLWVPALRSDKFKQGQGTLIQINEDEETLYCCLGVLCVLAIKAGVKGLRLSSDALSFEEQDFDTEEWTRCGAGTLPHAVQKWASLDDDPLIEDGVTAIEANDSMLLSFTDIADRVEANL
jgi:hypothetical protein